MVLLRANTNEWKIETRFHFNFTRFKEDVCESKLRIENNAAEIARRSREAKMMDLRSEKLK